MPHRLGTASLIGALLLIATGAHAFPSGPPAHACLSQQPFHNTAASMYAFHPATAGNPSYHISTSSPTWTSNGTLTVTLTGNHASRTFKGFILKAMRMSDNFTNANLGPLLGSFSMCNTSAGVAAKYQSVYASGGENNCVSHSQARTYSSVSCQWNAPVTNEGPIMFMATVVAAYNSYQTQIGSATLNNTAGMPTASCVGCSLSYSVNDLVEKPTLFGCGNTKTCALYPPSCDIRGGCKYGVMMTPRATGVMFEVFGTTHDWLAVGLGDSPEMKDLEIFACGYDPMKKRVNLNFGFAPAKCYFSLYRSDITMIGTRFEVNSGNTVASLPVQPNTIYCQFMRPTDATFTFYNFNMTSGMNNRMTINNNLAGNGKYVVLAQGLNIGNTAHLGKHTHQPLRSPAKFSASGGRVTMYFDGLEKSVQTHATLMTIFWLFLCGFGIIVARHTRPVFTQQLVKKQLWFLLHAAFIVLGYVIAIAGVVYILVKGGGWQTDSQTHGILGLIGMSLGLLNIIAGIFRPHPGTRFRPIFNRLHRWNGLLAFLFAAIAIWLGATFESHRPEFRFWAVIVLGLWSGLQIIFMVGFEIARQRMARSKRQEMEMDKRFQMTTKAISAHSVGEVTASDLPLESDEEPKVKGKQLVHINEVWVVFYAVVFLAMAAAFWAGLWIH